MNTLHCVPLHFTYEILVLDIHDGAHKVFNTLGCEGDTIKRDIGSTTCCVENGLSTSASPQLVKL